MELKTLLANVRRKMDARRSERLGIIERHKDLLAKRELSRADLHNLLDAALDVGALDRALPGTEPPPFAVDAAERLLEAISSRPGYRPSGAWFAPTPEALRADPELWRAEVYSRLRHSPTLLPPWLKEELLAALSELDRGDGLPPRLLTPLVAPGRGRNPKERAAIEERLCGWIYHKHGDGMRVSDAVAAVAAATGTSAKNVEAWRAAWRRRAGADEVARELASARDDPAFRAIWTQSNLEGLALLWNEARRRQKAIRRLRK